VEAADAVLLTNAAFRLGRQRIGVGLYAGIGELDLSNLYDTHAITSVADLLSVALVERVVTTAHGMTLLPSRTIFNALGLDRLVVPGVEARERAAPLLAASRIEPELIHADAPHRFGLEPVLEDLARTADVPTARFALRRMEYRSDSIRLDGDAVGWRSLAWGWALGLSGFFLTWVLFRRRV
jgi:hypothetical protein